MASEDSDELVPGFAAVHRLRYLNDVREPGRLQMSSFVHEFDAARELLEVQPLRRPKRIPLKERDDRFTQLKTISHDVLPQILLVVIVPPVDGEPTDPEELL